MPKPSNDDINDTGSPDIDLDDIVQVGTKAADLYAGSSRAGREAAIGLLAVVGILLAPVAWLYVLLEVLKMVGSLMEFLEPYIGLYGASAVISLIGFGNFAGAALALGGRGSVAGKLLVGVPVLLIGLLLFAMGALNILRLLLAQ